MARMVVMDDEQIYAQMLAAPLKEQGHEVMIAIHPVDFNRVIDFQPDVVSVGLSRRERAFNRPIVDFDRDVLGSKPLRDLEDYPAMQAVPLVLVGTGLFEEDVPTSLRYDLFLVIPRDLSLYVERMVEATKQKKRRRLGPYVCPNESCRSRLAEVGDTRHRDLYCPRCGMGVAIDGDTCHYAMPEAPNKPLRCSIEDLRPRTAG